MITLENRRFAAFATAIAMSVLVGCTDALEVEPTNEVRDDQAIIDAGSARSALAGAYDAMQSGSYYGGAFNFFNELPTDNVEHVGTFTTYADIDQNRTAADNSSLEGVWDAMYDAIGRTNTLIARVGAITDLSDEEKDDIVGQAHLLRALHYHNLFRFWGPVPIRTAPPTDLSELAATERATADQVFTQINSDLTQAAAKISNDSDTRRANVGAVPAIRSRVALWRGDWAGAIAAANAVISMGYDLAPSFEDLFTPDGGDTAEDIWLVSFTPVEYNLLGFYYITKSFGGRLEVAPTLNLEQAFEAGDFRKVLTVRRDSRNRRYGAKYPTTVGAEDPHIIRFAEVLLNKAEAQAQLDQLGPAVDTYNLIRQRAGLQPHTLGVEVTTKAQVLAAIYKERRLELALEGDRFGELVRTGRAVSTLSIPAFRTVFPIPQNEIDVAPRITQNAGY